MLFAFPSAIVCSHGLELFLCSFKIRKVFSAYEADSQSHNTFTRRIAMNHSRPVLLLIITCFFFLAYPLQLQAVEAPAKVVELAGKTLAAMGSDPVIIAAVKDENRKNKSLDKIKADDKIWSVTPGISPFMKAILESECSKHLRKIKDSQPYYSEIFVMDNKGANVALTNKTSDYWQGDEDKFLKSFNNGKGSVFIDKVKFDDSSQSYLVQVSVPVKDGGKTIGAITFGIDVEKVK